VRWSFALLPLILVLRTTLLGDIDGAYRLVGSLQWHVGFWPLLSSFLLHLASSRCQIPMPLISDHLFSYFESWNE